MKTDVIPVPNFLAALAGKDIKVWVERDQLRCNAPAGALTPEFRDQLRNRKSEIIGFLTMAEAATRQQPAIVPIQPRGTLPPIYAVPGHAGAVFSFSAFSKRLGDDQPFFALEPPGLDERVEPMDRVEDIAAYFANQILEFQPTGPCVIAGYCSGAATAFELAKLLGQQGVDVQCLALFGPLHPNTYQAWHRQFIFEAKRRVGAVSHHLRKAARQPSFGEAARYVGERLTYLRGRIRDRLNRHRPLLSHARPDGETAKADPMLTRRFRLQAAAIAAVGRYTPAPYTGRMCIFLPNKAWLRSGAGSLHWLQVAPQAEVYYGPESCYGPLMLAEPDAPAIAELYRQSLRGGERIS